MVVLTADQDWAPDWTVLDLVSLWEEAGVAGTLFVTHRSPALESMRSKPGLELGIHPNYSSGSSHGDDAVEVQDHVSELVPDAVGVRSHSLLAGTNLLLEYGNRGLIYEGSYLMEGAAGLEPAMAWNGVVRLPIFWEDDVHMLHGRDFRLAELRMERPGLKVFDFHPVHVALNSFDLQAYGRLKQLLQGEGRGLGDATKEDFESVRTDGRRGTRDLLVELLDWLGRHRERAEGTMRRIASATRRAEGWSEP